MVATDSDKLGRVIFICLLICAIIAPLAKPEVGIYFFVIFIASILIGILYGFVVKWIRRDFQRPVWLDILYLIALVTLPTSILATALRWGDTNVWRSIGFVGLVVFGMCIAVEALLGILGFRIDLDALGLKIDPNAKRKLKLVIVGLGGLLMAGIGIATLMGWDGPWGSG